MILEALRVVTDWLNDGTYGAAAKLAALDYDGSDTAPSGTLTILDETRADDAALNRESAPPTIRVAATDVRELVQDGALQELDGDVSIELTIIRAATSPSAVVRDLYYTTRAVSQSLADLFDDRIADALTARTRGGVQVQGYTSLAAAQVRPELTDTTGTAGLVLTVRCRDTSA